jgi:N-acetylmuramoyl-L-alanine amidase
MNWPRIGTIAVIALALAFWPGARDHAWAQSVASTAKAGGPTCSRASFHVVIDVGHTAEAPGAKSARGHYEYDFNLRLAKLIEQKLTESGFEKTVLLITHGKSRKGLTERVAHASKASADLFLSIHHDSVPDKFLEKWQFEGAEHIFSDKFKGHSIFVSRDNGSYGASLLFGKLLGNELKTRGLQYTPHYTEKFMGRRQRQLVDSEAGVYRYDQLIVLKNTRMPAVLLEAGSIINRDEELAMENPERQSLIAAAAVDAVDGFCAARQPHNQERIARQPGNTSPIRSTFAPAAAVQPASHAKPLR